MSLQSFKSLFPVVLQIFEPECHGQISLKTDFVKFGHVFIKFRKIEKPLTGKQKARSP